MERNGASLLNSLRQEFIRLFRIFLLVAFALVVPVFSQVNSLEVSVNRAKLEAGETVEITIRRTGKERVKAVLLEPVKGLRDISLTETVDGHFRSKIEIQPGSKTGLYVIHAWTGERAKPSSVGKANFRVGNIVADFFIANYLDKQSPATDLDAYLRDFRLVGGNFLIAHNLIISSGAFYPSKIARTEVTMGGDGDVVELLLDRADRQGIPLLLSVGWDMTRESPYKDRMEEIRAITTELYKLYRHHPSLAGFYSWQEGSGTYYAAYAREFGAHVKSLDRGLLTACAPHIDDALLASYLSVIEDLDMMIYQSAVMASYRPDNRKEYPLRRVRDFSGLGAGAKRVQNKIVLTHVELFAYMEKRLRPEVLTASYNDIYGQILSAATVTDTDGIALFSYHSHIFDQSKRFEAGRVGRSAVEKGLKMFQEITTKVSKERNRLALYIPYSDFVIERWNNYFLPALDAFRALGVPIDILPYAPPLEESIYPYYPIHMNKKVLDRLLHEKTVLVLANVSGFQQTDSDLIKAFVERGGAIIAFGPQIPYGRTFERQELFGGTEIGEDTQTRILPKADSTILRNTATIFPRTKLPSWKAGTASIMAKYGDGSAAILTNRFGAGAVYTILPDARFSVDNFPRLVRQVLNDALKNEVLEITGTDTNMDIATRGTKGVFTVAIVNHNSSASKAELTADSDLVRCLAKAGQGQGTSIRIIGKSNRIAVQIPINEAVTISCERF